LKEFVTGKGGLKEGEREMELLNCTVYISESDCKVTTISLDALPDLGHWRAAALLMSCSIKNSWK
jgi:hypothetical protein